VIKRPFDLGEGLLGVLGNVEITGLILCQRTDQVGSEFRKEKGFVSIVGLKEGLSAFCILDYELGVRLKVLSCHVDLIGQLHLQLFYTLGPNEVDQRDLVHVDLDRRRLDGGEVFTLVQNVKVEVAIEIIVLERTRQVKLASKVLQPCLHGFFSQPLVLSLAGQDAVKRPV
jgi:hypothetical protein